MFLKAHSRLALSLLSILMFCNTSSAQTHRTRPNNNEFPALQLGKSQVADLKPNQNHLYRFSLKEGDYLRVSAIQQGIDISLQFFQSNGVNFSVIDDVVGLEGKESCVLLIDKTGDYLLKVFASDRTAKPGKYTIQLDELRASSKKDLTYLTASAALADGDILFSRISNPGYLPQILEKYETAQKLFHEIADIKGEGAALKALGNVYRATSEYKKAIEYYEKALPIMKSLNDEYNRASILIGLGDLWNILDEQDKALQLYENAMPIWKATNNSYGEAYTLSCMGSIYLNNNDFQRAISLYERTVPIYQQLNSVQGEVNSQSSLGNCYFAIDDYQTALIRFQSTLALIDKYPDKTDQKSRAYTLNNLAMTYTARKEFPAALENYNEALTIFRALNENNAVAATMLSIGGVYNLINDATKALEFHNQALSSYQTAKDRKGEATALSNIGLVYSKSAEKEKGKDAFQKSLKIFQELQFRGGIAAMNYALAQVERDLGNYNNALNLIVNALKLIDPTFSLTAKLDLKSFAFAPLHDYFELYVDILMQMHKASPTENYQQRALQISERWRSVMIVELLQKSRSTLKRLIVPALQDEESKLREKITKLVKLQLRLFDEAQTANQIAALDKEITKLNGEYDQLRIKLKNGNPYYSAIMNADVADLKTIQDQLLDSDTILLEYMIGVERSYLWIIAKDQLKSFELPAQQDLENSIKPCFNILSMKDAVAREKAFNSDYNGIATTLSQIILGTTNYPLGNKRLLIVADGMLQFIPFNALPDPKESSKPLLIDHEIVNLTSATALINTRQWNKDRQVAERLLLALTDPILGINDRRVLDFYKPDAINTFNITEAQQARLVMLKRTAIESGVALENNELTRSENAREEIKKILANVDKDQCRLLTDANANKEILNNEEILRYRYLYLGLPGFINSVHPEFAGFGLSYINEKLEGKDAYLRMSEIYNLQLAADVVTLPNTKASLERGSRNGAINGMVQGFAVAGAPRVVMSMWGNEGEAFSEVLTKFHEEMINKKQRPVAALRTAQLASRNDMKEAFYWAAWQFYGDWR